MKAARHKSKHAAGKRSFSSQWQQKYGKTSEKKAPSIDDELDQDADNLADWIESVQQRAHEEAAAATVPDAIFMSDILEPTDKEAADVIENMNKLLDDGLSSCSINDNNDDIFNNVDFHHADLDVEQEQQIIDFDNEDFSKYLQLPSIEDDPIVQGTLSIDIREEVAILFRRSHDEHIVKKCFDCLVEHAKDSKLVRARVFCAWKRITKQANDSKDQFVRRFQRRHRLRCMRRVLNSWLLISNERCIMLQRVADKQVLRTKSNVYTAWRRQFELERTERHTKRCNVAADDFCRLRLKQSFFVKWRLAVKRRKSDDCTKLKLSKVSTEQQDTNNCALIIPDEEDTPIKRPTQSTIYITPEKGKKALDLQRSECVDKENQKPNRINNKLLQPLKPQRKPLRNPTTPKLVKEMDQRKKEREKQREILRHRYEQKAIEKKRQLEEEKLRKEENETKVANEYKQRKAEEELRKVVTAARWKQACRLSILHYRMSLQKRVLQQWKKIFKIKSFNERKVRKKNVLNL